MLCMWLKLFNHFEDLPELFIPSFITYLTKSGSRSPEGRNLSPQKKYQLYNSSFIRQLLFIKIGACVSSLCKEKKIRQDISAGERNIITMLPIEN